MQTSFTVRLIAVIVGVTLLASVLANIVLMGAYCDFRRRLDALETPLPPARWPDNFVGFKTEKGTREYRLKVYQQ